MREDLALYERVFEMDAYAEWSDHDRENPKETPYSIVDWLAAVEADAGIVGDDAAERAKQLFG